MSNQPSPLPWTFDRKYGVLVDRDGKCVTWTDAGPEPQNAAVIVRAVNVHGSLVAALKGLRDCFDADAGDSIVNRALLVADHALAQAGITHVR